MQGKKQYSEQLFKSFQLSQRVPEENFYRRLKDFLNLQWLYKETKKYYGTEGQQSIDPVVFFKLILIGQPPVLPLMKQNNHFSIIIKLYIMKCIYSIASNFQQFSLKALLIIFLLSVCSFENVNAQCTSNDQSLCTSIVTDAVALFTGNSALPTGTTTVTSTTGPVFTATGPNNSVELSITSGVYQVITPGCVFVRFNMAGTASVTTTNVTVVSNTGVNITCTNVPLVSGTACMRICAAGFTVGSLLTYRLDFLAAKPAFNGSKTVIVSAFSTFDLVSLAPTPVSLINFEYQIKNCAVNLKWATAQEINSKEFILQNSTNGTTWLTIGKVNAKGNSSSRSDYNFVHQNPVNGQNFYRFAAIDKDGTTKYSPVISVNVACGKAVIVVNPNPFTDNVNIYFTSVKAGTVTISLRDNTGRQVYSRQTTVQSGSNTINLKNLDRLSQGIYILSVKTDEAVINQKLVK